MEDGALRARSIDVQIAALSETFHSSSLHAHIIASSFAEKHTAESLAAAEQNWLEVMDDLKYYEREYKAIAHRGGAAAQEAELHLVTAQDKLGRAGALKDGAAEAWRMALAEMTEAAEGVSEAKRGAAEAGVSTVNPRMSTGEQRQASRDEAWRRRQVVRVLKTRRSADGRLEALVRWRAHGPSRDSWEDAAALGLMEQGVVATQRHLPLPPPV